mmetsp:Transcript_37189/g.90216  ORF Transcript_37189/g.90216 Transcript_37189/m.90216 type:complete len:986 (-) Transcript_37189:201-3158(-)|eukprot:CAMPEP_0113487626 /NCGR_PEP_ID=MMETSP0014_2-20120614/25603_1 /TAXON_ID=2857 /ORGANISM="Nitzschia sp." /LENGTH=985 /DNA_ID=CAMNT_0000381323 /DNA_START=242 /DNA_END=3199 /DNA_ORIENTATION=- /assembly_acc=CAM_ASM_000159
MTSSASQSTTSTCSSSWSSSYLQKKAEKINLLLLEPQVDLWKLRELALTDGGLVNDTLRKRAWPKLVGLDYKLDPIILASSEGRSRDGSSTDNSKTKTLPRPPTSKSVVPYFELAAKELKPQSSANNTGPPKEVIDPGNSTLPSSQAVLLSVDASQIDRDVARCTWHLLTGTQRSRRWQYQNKQGQQHQKTKKIAGLLKKKQKRLASLINCSLVTSYDWPSSARTGDGQEQPQQKLRYYQGYHDVACIFLHALGGAGSGGNGNSSMMGIVHNGNDHDDDDDDGTTTSMRSSSPSRSLPSTMPTVSPEITNNIGDLELPSRVLCQVSFSHFSDALQSNFVQLQTGLKLVLFPLLSKLDVDVHDHLLDADMEPFFCLSWIITWFAHDVRDTDLVKRLFDVFLVSHPLFPVYMSLAMMVHPYNRSIILQTDCDFASLHQCLASLPRNSCQVGWKKRDDGWEGAYISDDEPEDPHDDDDAWQSLTPPRPEAVSGSSEDPPPNSTVKDDRTVSTDGIEESLDNNSVSNQGNADSAPPATPPPRPYSSKKTSSSTYGDDDHIDRNPVPFQELIDTALGFIKKYPPTVLVTLSKAYYKDDWKNQLMLMSDNDFNYPSPSEIQRQISFLGPSPVWSTVPSCTSDWVIKQRLRQLFGLRATSRNDRRKQGAIALSSPQKPRPRRILSSAENTSAATPDALALSVSTIGSANTDQGHSSSGSSDINSKAESTKEEIELYLKTNTKSLAVIAVGYGPGYWSTTIQQRRRRRRRRTAVVVMGTATAVVMVGAIAMSINMTHVPGQTPEIRAPVSSGVGSITDDIVLPKIDVLHETGGKVHVGTTTASLTRGLKNSAGMAQSPERRVRNSSSTPSDTTVQDRASLRTSTTSTVKIRAADLSSLPGTAMQQQHAGGGGGGGDISPHQTLVMKPLQQIIRVSLAQMVRLIKKVEVWAVRIAHIMHRHMVVNVWQFLVVDISTIDVNISQPTQISEKGKLL